MKQKTLSDVLKDELLYQFDDKIILCTNSNVNYAKLFGSISKVYSNHVYFSNYLIYENYITALS